MNCQQFAKFHAKRLNRSENISKSFMGGIFFYKSLFHHTVVDKNEKYRKTNLTNDRKKHK